MYEKIVWPKGKKFAFTVFDDTDLSTVNNVRPVYDFLEALGFRTTKTVWPIRGNKKPNFGGSTCEDSVYLEWLYYLKKRGFEIGYHLATYHTSNRNETAYALKKFADLFGHYPHSMANHTRCLESIYWGNFRVTGFVEFLYNLLTLNRNKDLFKGHIEGDKYFWGDICKKKIEYVRNFTFPDINTLKACPIMPYHDLQKPFVNYWFASSEGPDVISFNQCISEQNQDRLEEEEGACIIYTHFAKGFYENGEINPTFKFLIERLSRKNGWFVPVNELLDYLLEVKGHHVISKNDRMRLERKWLWHKLWNGPS